MKRVSRFDAVVVGAGPNGLAAAILLARAGVPTLLLEANDAVGGAARTVELTLPGFLHDVCSAILPMALISPLFRTLPLSDRGVRWIHSPYALAHPLDDGSAATLTMSRQALVGGVDPGDAKAWRALMEPLLHDADALYGEILRPMVHVPRHPFLMARFGLTAIRSAAAVARRFRGDAMRALFAGCAAHSILPLESAGSASFGMVLALSAYGVGWPCAERGTQTVANALTSIFQSYGGVIETSRCVGSMRDLPPSRVVVFDVAPRSLAAIAADELPARYLRRLRRFRYGPGVFKIDWALDGPIPWRAPECSQAATVHLGGSLEEIAAHESAVWRGRVTETPFVLVAQQSLFDPTRAPAGKHTGWAYCHVPNGSTADMSDAIERQVERFAPGFRDRILARHTMNTAAFEMHDANIVGGDIAGGANTLWQLLARPVARWNPYATPNERIFIGSSSTPPGGGVHGMCGFGAATSALRKIGVRTQPE